MGLIEVKTIGTLHSDRNGHFAALGRWFPTPSSSCWTHYSIRTEYPYCDGIRRYFKFHKMQSRSDLEPAEARMDQFLSHHDLRARFAVLEAPA